MRTLYWLLLVVSGCVIPTGPEPDPCEGAEWQDVLLEGGYVLLQMKICSDVRIEYKEVSR